MSNHKYEVLNQEYHPKACVDLNSLSSSHQRFLLRLRSNQLCTLSKMSYWSNNPLLDTKCPQCHDAHEDQLHVLLDCKYNSTYFKDAMIKIEQVIKSNLKTGSYISGKHNFWGLPFRITNSGLEEVQDKREISSVWRYNMYLSLLGYTRVDTMKVFKSIFPVKKPLTVLH